MPALFIGHGSPMNTLERNRYTEIWATLGAALPRPSAILAISAHWYIEASAVTAMERPHTIHDFYGFPQPLFDFQYPAPGSPELAQGVRDALAPMPVALDADQWGLDHGTWSVLAHMFPTADVPVVQLSIDMGRPAGEHLAIGAALNPLRDEGVLVLSSGNVVHNLRRMNPVLRDAGEPWAHRFDDAAVEVMTTRPGDAPMLADHPDYALAVPTAEHFLPLLYTAGIAAASGDAVTALARGYAMGSLSMTCHAVGLDAAQIAAVAG